MGRAAIHSTLCLAAILVASCGAAQEQRPFEPEPEPPAPAPKGDFGRDPIVDGRLEPIDGPTCGTANIALAKSPVYLQIIMDGSGSMADGGKWEAASKAMVRFFEDVYAKQDTALAVGLFLFDGTQSLQDFSLPQVPIRYVDSSHLNTLRLRVLGSTPSGGTPIRLSLEGQLPVLKAFVPIFPLRAGGRRILLLLTDGVPDGPADVQPQVQQQCVTLVENAAKDDPPINTFIIGVGDPTADPGTFNEEFVGRLAVAGGMPATGCTPGWNQSSPAGQKPCHFQVTPGQRTPAQIQADITAAIEALRGAAASCEYLLEQPDGAPGVSDPSKVNVELTMADGSRVTIPQSGIL